MIITRTPFRISFVGGGTDFPSFFTEHGGCTLLTTIDKYCYVLVHPCNPCFKYNFKASYAITETVMEISELQHPIIRETLRYLNIDQGIEINYVSDLPGRAGLGTSSSFTVGLLNALHCMKNEKTTRLQLADEAIHVERELVGDPGGHQDQYAAAVGGLIRLDFTAKGVQETPVHISSDRVRQFNDYVMLFYLGLERSANKTRVRSANKILERQEKRKEANLPYLLRMKTLVDEAQGILESDEDFSEFGRVLHEAWSLKKQLSEHISNPMINDAYDAALEAGALGGKLLGAGGGGFLMLIAGPDIHAKISERLSKLRQVAFSFESAGSSVILQQSIKQVLPR